MRLGMENIQICDESEMGKFLVSDSTRVNAFFCVMWIWKSARVWGMGLRLKSRIPRRWLIYFVSENLGNFPHQRPKNSHRILRKIRCATVLKPILKKNRIRIRKNGNRKMKNQTCAFDHQLMSETIDVSEHTTFY
jgi:hypothetical protein